MILEDMDSDIGGEQSNITASSTTVSPLSITSPAPTISNSRKSYDNAYFYILFVMFFYFFLSATLFKRFIRSDKVQKDPYQEFVTMGLPSAQKFNPGPTAERFYFEEESSL